MEHLPELLWAYRTTARAATHETPFGLAYGTEAIAPVEIGIPSPRTELANPKRNDESLLINLDLLDEKSEKAL